MGPYIYDVHMEGGVGGGGGRGWGLEIWHVYTNQQICCSFLQMGSGLGVKNCFCFSCERHNCMTTNIKSYFDKKECF